MHKAYALVIDLLMSGKVNHEQISLSLAKSDPDAFLTAWQKCKEASANPAGRRKEIDTEILNQLGDSNNRVAAIKRCRELCGWGLKEAKDYVEALMGAAIGSNKLPNPSDYGSDVAFQAKTPGAANLDQQIAAHVNEQEAKRQLEGYEGGGTFA